MKSSKQERRGAKGLFRSCLVDGVLDEARVRQVVDRVAEGKPRGYFGILSHFLHLIRLEVARRTARIESAVPLPQDAQNDIRSRLTRVYGAGLAAGFAVNAGLIGGLRIKVGSDVYDGSVEARLSALEESF